MSRGAKLDFESHTVGLNPGDACYMAISFYWSFIWKNLIDDTLNLMYASYMKSIVNPQILMKSKDFDSEIRRFVSRFH